MTGIYNTEYGCGDSCEELMNWMACDSGDVVASDGRDWWIGSYEYNEPNGDWDEGCHLRAEVPSADSLRSGDTITYNDEGCPSSGSYYMCSTNTHTSLAMPSPSFFRMHLHQRIRPLLRRV